MSLQAPVNFSSADLQTDLKKNVQQAAFVAQLKRLYSANQQAEFLFIQAEADSLLVELEHLKSQQTQPTEKPLV